MGNTTSIASNILLFPPPSSSKRTHPHRPHPPSPGCPGSPSASSSPKYVLAPPSPTPHQPSGPIARSPSIHCYAVRPTSHKAIHSTLSGLCNDLRLPSDRLTRRTISIVDNPSWIPSAIFHTEGDFQNTLSNSLVSVLFTRTHVRRIPQREEEVTSTHTWLHIYSGTHLAQPFGAVLKDMVYRGVLEEVKLRVKADTVQMVEACALVAVKYWVEGGQEAEEQEGRERGLEVSGIVGKMMGQLEGLLWGVWLEGAARWERRQGEEGWGCVPS